MLESSKRQMHPGRSPGMLSVQAWQRICSPGPRSAWKEVAIERYEIIVQGPAGARWPVWFEGMTLEDLPGGQVRIVTGLLDQPGLHGKLEQIRDINLTLILVRRLDTQQ